jgi:asparagine N-glycosylation enzyme membrane subunit Stt3
MAREKNGSGELGVGSRSDSPASAPTPHFLHPAPLAAAFFVLALACRLLNAPYAFDGGKPRIAPVDELYHWKRMAYSAAHFPRVLEFDRDRGVSGAFCPWPPLYDVIAGGAARLLGASTSTDKSVCATQAGATRDGRARRSIQCGAHTLQCGTDTLVCAASDDVLRRIIWFPPILFAIFTGVAVFILARRSGAIVATITGIALATSPFLVTTSWIGSIDHHYLEPVLTFATLGAACLGIRARTRRERVVAGVLLGIAITAAMFVQTALLIAAALAFAVLFFASDGVAATCGFGIAAIAVGTYRLTREPGFPDNQWFLGWTHATLFAAAAIACAILAARRSAGGSPAGPREPALSGVEGPRRRVFALLLGALIAIAIPTVRESLFSGSHFLGGDRWLRTIQEFQPLWRARGDDLVSDIAGLSGGAILVWFLAIRAIKTRDNVRTTIAVFAIVYLALTITSRRFWIVAIPLLALAGATYVPLIARKRLAILAALVIALPPPLQLAGWLMTPQSIPPNQQQWIRATSFMKTLPPGRVLGPWSMGHAIDVEGHHPVIVDNFGTMPDTATFARAQEVLLANDDATLARYCDAANVRYLILEQPRFGIASANAILGTHRAAQSTWWWRVWGGEKPRMFRLIWSEAELRMFERSSR